MAERNSLELHDLPDEVAYLLQTLDMHPYLLAHLVVVHDVACKLLEGVRAKWPALEVDEDLVRFGAATHDIGKHRHREELSGPGKKHHGAGAQLLQELGVESPRARFAYTHGAWREDEGLTIEDLLVALADVVWSGGRERRLEDLVTKRLASSDRRKLWETFMDLDDLLTEISRHAELRLVWQTQFAPDDQSLEQGRQVSP